MSLAQTKLVLRREQQPNVIVDKEEWDILSLF
jgi:hypothetical protein